jgi:short-subunit dehydrogenase
MFLKDFVKKDSGFILNVASAAGLLKGGPLMSTYYATKNYITSFSFAIYEELRRTKSNVKISVLCPGPVDTNFNSVAKVKFSVKALNARDVARYGVNQMIKKNKLKIVPGATTRIRLFFTRFLSLKAILKMTYKFQKKDDQ